MAIDFRQARRPGMPMNIGQGIHVKTDAELRAEAMQAHMSDMYSRAYDVGDWSVTGGQPQFQAGDKNLGSLSAEWNTYKQVAGNQADYRAFAEMYKQIRAERTSAIDEKLMKLEGLGYEKRDIERMIRSNPTLSGEIIKLGASNPESVAYSYMPSNSPWYADLAQGAWQGSGKGMDLSLAELAGGAGLMGAVGGMWQADKGWGAKGSGALKGGLKGLTRAAPLGGVRGNILDFAESTQGQSKLSEMILGDENLQKYKSGDKIGEVKAPKDGSELRKLWDKKGEAIKDAQSKGVKFSETAMNKKRTAYKTAYVKLQEAKRIQARAKGNVENIIKGQDKVATAYKNKWKANFKAKNPKKSVDKAWDLHKKTKHFGYETQWKTVYKTKNPGKSKSQITKAFKVHSSKLTKADEILKQAKENTKYYKTGGTAPKHLGDDVPKKGKGIKDLRAAAYDNLDEIKKARTSMISAGTRYKTAAASGDTEAIKKAKESLQKASAKYKDIKDFKKGKGYISSNETISKAKKAQIKAVKGQALKGVQTYLKKHGASKLISEVVKKAGWKTAARIAGTGLLGTGLTASGIGTAAGLALDAYTVYEIYNILKDTIEGTGNTPKNIKTL